MSVIVLDTNILSLYGCSISPENPRLFRALPGFG